MREGAVDAAVVAFARVFKENREKFGDGSAPTKAALAWIETYGEWPDEVRRLQNLWARSIKESDDATERPL